jgi:HPt (histidine-containing phosphotransfer) domain-containing protein
MDAYLAKPCRPRALFESIQRVTTSPSSSTKLETLAPIVFDKSGFLSRLEGDEQLGWEVIEMFLREYPKLKQNVRSAAEQRNPSLLERAAHALKGSVGDVAAPQAFEAARILEQMARGGKLDAVDAQLVSLEGALDRLVRELRKVEKNAA